MKLFFMDKVEQELRESAEYGHMLDALGTTLDRVRRRCGCVLSVSEVWWRALVLRFQVIVLQRCSCLVCGTRLGLRLWRRK